MILLYVLAHIRDEFLHTLLEIRVYVGHHATDGVVVQDETAAAGLFEDVEYLFTVAEAVEERRCGAEILTEAGEEEDVRVYTLQLVHDGAYHLHAVAHLHAHGFLYGHAERVAVLHGAEIVQTVGQCQSLRISHVLADLLHCAVYIAQYGIDLLDAFAFKTHAEVEHAVRRRVLRADVHHILVFAEYAVLRARHRTVGIERERLGHIGQGLVRHAQRIVLLGLVVLTEGIAHPVLAHEDAAHVGVAGKFDTVEVVHLAFVDVGHIPQVAHTGQQRVFAVGGHGLQAHLPVGRGRLQLIDDAEALFLPVHTGEVDEKVHAFLVSEALHLGAQCFGSEYGRLEFVLGRFGGSGRCGRLSGCRRLGGCGCSGLLCVFLYIVTFHHACSSSL